MSHHRARLAVPVLAVALLSLGACTPDEPEPTPSTEASASPTTPEWKYTTPTNTAEASDGGQADSLEPEKADDDARQGARDAALATAEVWVKGQEMDQVDWSNALMNTLTPYAQDAYADRWWGYRIEATKITGDPEIKAVTKSTGTVIVPTDDGDLTITVTRPDPNSRWLASGIDTP